MVAVHALLFLDDSGGDDLQFLGGALVPRLWQMQLYVYGLFVEHIFLFLLAKLSPFIYYRQTSAGRHDEESHAGAEEFHTDIQRVEGVGDVGSGG